MRGKHPSGSFWPSPGQQALLEVALADAETAAASWLALRPTLDLDRLEAGTFELLPLVYRNLMRAGLDDPDLPRLKGTYRKAWVQNTMRLERTAATASALDAASIRALYVQGVALAGRFYAELGLRAASAVDVVLDDPLDADRADGPLREQGWAFVGRSADDDVRYYSDEVGNTLLLRTCFAPRVSSGPTRNAGPSVWEAAESWRVGDVDLAVPSPTDTLFAICSSNARAGNGRTTQWLADAKMVMARDLDWDRVVALVRRHGQTLRLQAALRYLAVLPGVRPPASASAALEAVRPGASERLVYAVEAGSLGNWWRTPVRAGRGALRRVGAR